MKTTKYVLGTIKMKMRPNGFPDGFILKRLCTYVECRHIVKDLLGIDIYLSGDFDDKEEWAIWKKDFVDDVNGWLSGDVDDSQIMEYASDCADEPLGMMNAFPIAKYLIERGII